MLASDIISRVRIVLNDLTGVHWADPELLSWINDGQLIVAIIRPDSVARTAAMSLVAGTKQSIPSDGIRLLDVVRNVGGRAIRIIDRDVLDLFDPNWHKSTAGEIKHYVYDNRVPMDFYVYPQAKAAQQIEITYSKIPTKVAATTDALAVADIYQDIIVNYVLFRAYSKDAEHAANASMAATYLQIVNSLAGVKLSKDVAFAPQLNSRGDPPNAAAIQTGGV